MKIVLNGKELEIKEQATIGELIGICGMTPDKVAVELNRRLVRSAGYGNVLKQGDEIEIVTFVGGG